MTPDLNPSLTPKVHSGPQHNHNTTTTLSSPAQVYRRGSGERGVARRRLHPSDGEDGSGGDSGVHVGAFELRGA